MNFLVEISAVVLPFWHSLKQIAFPQVSTGRSPDLDSASKSQHEGFTRHGTGNSEVVQRRQGFWLHQSAEWRGCVRALLSDQYEWLQEPAGRSSRSVQRGEGAQGLAGV